MDGKNDMHTTYLSYLTTYLTSTLHKDQQQEKNNNNIYNTNVDSTLFVEIFHAITTTTATTNHSNKTKWFSFKVIRQEIALTDSSIVSVD